MISLILTFITTHVFAGLVMINLDVQPPKDSKEIFYLMTLPPLILKLPSPPTLVAAPNTVKQYFIIMCKTDSPIEFKTNCRPPVGTNEQVLPESCKTIPDWGNYKISGKLKMLQEKPWYQPRFIIDSLTCTSY